MASSTPKTRGASVGARRVFPVAANGAGIGEGGIGAGGDALFPALALAPRAAILATAYSAIPALLIGYGW